MVWSSILPNFKIQFNLKGKLYNVKKFSSYGEDLWRIRDSLKVNKDGGITPLARRIQDKMMKTHSASKHLALKIGSRKGAQKTVISKRIICCLHFHFSLVL